MIWNVNCDRLYLKAFHGFPGKLLELIKAKSTIFTMDSLMEGFCNYCPVRGIYVYSSPVFNMQY